MNWPSSPKWGRPFVVRPYPASPIATRVTLGGVQFTVKCRIIEVMDSKLTIVFEPAEEGGFTAFIPEVPGAVSQGETVEEAREMVMDALHELTAYRREVALRGKGPKTLVERIATAF